MQFHNVAELVLGSKVKLKVLLYLLSEKILASEREISRVFGVSRTAVNKVLKDFYAANLVMPMKVGNVSVWKLNTESYVFDAITSLTYLANGTPLKEIEEKLRIFFDYKFVKNVIIFGSVAEGAEKPNSDIDVCIILEKDEKKKIQEAVAKLEEEFIRRYGNKLSALIYTTKEFQRPKKLAEQINKGIKLVQ
jgi:predicted nucleotidyltransferase